MIRILLLCLILPSAALGARTIETLPGYWAYPFYEGLPSPTSICFGPDGTLYVSSLDGKVRAIPDPDHNGIPDSIVVVVSGYAFPLGLAFDDKGQLYMSSRDLISCPVDTNADLVADYVESLFTGFPIGLHQNSGIAFGPYGNLYVTCGSTSNNGEQPFMAASILRLSPQGDFIDIFSTGHRNPYDLAFSNGVLYAPDNSVSADSVFHCWAAPDEVNRVVFNGDYGFPHCFGVGDCVDLSEYCTPPCGAGDCERGDGCGGSITPQVYLDPHSAPAGICSAEGFPGFNDTEMFVALWGQSEPVQGCNTNFGHKVIWFDSATGPTAPPFDFATGFLAPVDVAVGPDSSLYVADFMDGTIYRIIATSATGVPDDALPTLKVRTAPNPARSSVALRWGAPGERAAEVRVFDINGRVVAEIPAARSGDTWDLRNQDGQRVAPGVYWVQVRVGKQTGAKKLLVIK